MTSHSYPSFKTFIHAEVLSQKNQVMLFNDNHQRYLLSGEVYVHLTPYLLQGTLSCSEIIDQLSDQFESPEIYYALLCLEKHGFLEENSKILPKEIQNLCNLLNISYDSASHLLNTISVSTHVFGEHDTKALHQALRELSIRIDAQGQFLIILTDNYRNPKLREFCLHLTTPYLLIKPTRSEVWIGPIFNPQQGPCFECLSITLHQNSFEEMFVEHEEKKQEPITIRTPTPSTMNTIAYTIAANEIFKWIVKGANPDLEAKILTYHFLNPTITSHQVIQKYHCSYCGSPTPLQPQPLTLIDQKKRFTEDGGHRIKSSEETYNSYQHLISPITGIIDFLIPAYQDPLKSIHAYESEHLITRFHGKTQGTYQHPRSRSGGKGKTSAQAKTSCLCESIERYSGIYQGNEYKKRSSYKSIQNDAIHPDSILLFSENQYKVRDKKNPNCSPYHFVPHPFDPNQETDWTPVWSLTKKAFQWIPSALCYYSYPFSQNENRFCIADSNGCAAGNTKEEAILQGFFELIEKDSVALWWYSRIQRPEIDLNSFHDPHINRIATAYHSMNRKLWVIDVTMDLKIPTFAAISCKNDETQGEILFGLGSHFDPSIALLRAITEMNQTLLFLEKSPEIRLVSPEERVIRQWIQNETLKRNPYLIPDSQTQKRKRSDFKRLDTENIKEDVLACQKIVESKGLEMLVLDQTRPDIGLPVVKVFVPGLRNFWNRYAPGRLYDVPIELGLVQRKLTEEELNPIPYFL